MTNTQTHTHTYLEGEQKYIDEEGEDKLEVCEAVVVPSQE